MVALRLTAGHRRAQLLADRVGYGSRSRCGGDRTRWLNEYLNSFPAGSTVTLPKDACFTIDGIVTIDSTTGLTVDGNGATLDDPIAGVNGGTDATECPTHPILLLTRDTGLTLENLNLEGAYNGHNGGKSIARAIWASRWKPIPTPT